MFEAVAIFAIALAGGLLPLLVRWTDRILHSALALSTGIFLGAVFLHMLPALTAKAPAANPGGSAHVHGSMLTWLFVLIGVLAVYLLEGLVFRSHDHDDLHRHRAVGYASLAGLSAHSLTNGLGLGAALLENDVARPMFLAIVAHKGFETFSLAMVFQLAAFSRRWILGVMSLYALVTPVGALLGRTVFAELTPHGVSIVLAIAAGTFLYVCLCELLPELFHHKEDSLAKIALLALGIALMILVAEGEH